MCSTGVLFFANPVTKPYVRVVEQPLKSVRFRYYGERRRGTICGASSSSQLKTAFTIQIVGYLGAVSVIVSCVTHTPPHKPHPYNLFGPNCKDGYCFMTTKITAENPYISFPKLAIQCLKKHEIIKSLRVRKEKNIDPFLTGFKKSEDVKSIDLNVVRLCVQVFLKETGSIHPTALTPIVSEPIYNKKTVPDPIIYKLSHCKSYVHGGEDDIILLCPRISTDDIRIRFFEIKNGQEVWEDYGKFEPYNIYNNSAICFKPPRYHNQEITEPAVVFVQLVRPSDGTISPPVSFVYYPKQAVTRSTPSKVKTVSPSTLIQPANQSKESQGHLLDLSRSFTTSQFVLYNTQHDAITNTKNDDSGFVNLEHFSLSNPEKKNTE